MEYGIYNTPIAIDEALTIAHTYDDACKGKRAGTIYAVDVLEELGHIAAGNENLTDREHAMCEQIEGMRGCIAAGFSDDEIKRFAMGPDSMSGEEWVALTSRLDREPIVDDDQQLTPSAY